MVVGEKGSNATVCAVDYPHPLTNPPPWEILSHTIRFVFEKRGLEPPPGASGGNFGNELVLCVRVQRVASPTRPLERTLWINGSAGCFGSFGGRYAGIKHFLESAREQFALIVFSRENWKLILEQTKGLL
jgi:hypothetical protein